MKDTFNQDDYEVITRTLLYQGICKVFSYTLRHRLYAGKWSETFTREVIERQDSVAILPYDPIADQVILIEQFRLGAKAHPQNPWLLEIPAGMLDAEESTEEAAIREAHEEANCRILEVKPITKYFVSPGISTEYINLYCGKINATGIEGVFGLVHEHEDIRVLNLPTTDAFQMLRANQIQTAPAIISLLWLQSHKEALQREWGSISPPL